MNALTIVIPFFFWHREYNNNLVFVWNDSKRERKKKNRLVEFMGKWTNFKELNIFDRIEMGINLDKWVTESLYCVRCSLFCYSYDSVYCPSHQFSRSYTLYYGWFFFTQQTFIGSWTMLQVRSNNNIQK